METREEMMWRILSHLRPNDGFDEQVFVLLRKTDAIPRMARVFQFSLLLSQPPSHIELFHIRIPSNPETREGFDGASHIMVDRVAETRMLLILLKKPCTVEVSAATGK